MNRQLRALSLATNNKAMAKIDLDALIPREEFAIAGSSSQVQTFTTLSPKDFSTNNFIYHLLRKPIFQRETNEWDEEKIGDFLESLLNGDLIPSIILWRSQTGLLFVIDGAHRLSALLSWIMDDFGDGTISSTFYSGNIEPEKKEKSAKVRAYINKRIGAFKDISKASENPQSANYSKAAGLVNSMYVQWVPGDAKVAEASFFRINQQGVSLNTTEKKLLQSRDKGNCIAARAISKGGNGFKYWNDFDGKIQSDIERIAHEINILLFKPPLKIPVKSIDYLPLAGKSEPTQALPLILDFINIINGIPNNFNELSEKLKSGKKIKESFTLEDDKKGEYTLNYLRQVRKMAWRFSSSHASSLGLHPIIYFYTLDGRHKPASFYAVSAWMMEMTADDSINSYLDVRPKFEDLLLKYDYLFQAILRFHRQAIASYMSIKDFYSSCIRLLKDYTIDEAVETVISQPEFSYLKIDSKPHNEITSADFTDNRKSAVVIIKTLPSANKCEICGGLIDPKSLSIDHEDDKKNGGLGIVTNGQMVHPYCNSTYKDHLRVTDATKS